MPKQNISASDYPQAVIQQIELLAQNIVVARKRRKETQAQWAQRLGVSQPTMARVEKGDPSVAMASYVMCVWLINQNASIADLIAPQHDAIALEREVAKVRPRGRVQKVSKSLPSTPADTEVARAKEANNPVKRADSAADSHTKMRQSLQEQQSLASAAEKLGLGSRGALEKFKEQQRLTSAAESSVRTATGLAALIAKVPGSRKL